MLSLSSIGSIIPGGSITRRIFLTSALAAVASLTSKSSWFTTDSPAAMGSDAANVYGFSYTDIDGNEQSMSRYQGKVLIVANVASKCSYTKANYEELQQMFDKYKDKGLSVLAFPCNQFLNEEPGTESEIKEFACSRYKVTFDMAKKVDVNGSGAHPLWEFMKQQQGGTIINAIKWNFTKFLIDKQGRVVNRYGPTTNPKEFEADVQKLLEQQ